MAEFQVCSTGLDAPCASRLLSKPVLTLSHSSHHRTSPQTLLMGKGPNGDVEESRGAYALENRGGIESPRPPPLKRSRPDEDESLNSHMKMSPPNGNGVKYTHDIHHTGVQSISNNSSTISQSQQQQHRLMPQTNGHGTWSPALEQQQFGGDAHQLSAPSHHGGILYPPIPSSASYLGMNVNMAEVLAELDREKRKNIELQGRLSTLEAKLCNDEKHGCSLQNGSKRSKKQRKTDKIQGDGDEDEGRKGMQRSLSPLPAVKQEEGLLPHPPALTESMQPSDRQDNVVNWMSREDVTPADLEKLNSMASEKDDSGDSDDDDDDDDDDDEEEDEEEEDLEAKEDRKESRKRKAEGDEAWKGVRSEKVGREVGGLDIKVEGGGGFPKVPCNGREHDDDESDDGGKKKRRRKKRKDGKKGRRHEKASYGKRGFGHELPPYRGHGTLSSYKKALKTAFCPKEVKRIMESGVLALKNAQSHTMRKIIVFASLGIRHGCEDLYDLDFSHFSIVQRGEPFKSQKEPGEHVLYDHPGVRTKMFYPNRQNPILCPVKILDEEKAMRPAGPSCPTCLFLCIKYGGRTRNLPQNEYVRQRMGRNKLKSFGPLMCQMALLVHVRTGSFFFKALGITLLFMAGFPDDLVRKETKYRNLDLLQKYYRSDDDAKQELLFHPYTHFFPQATMVASSVTHKTSIVGSKVVGKKGPPPLLSKPPSTHTVPRYMPPMSVRAPTNTPFRGPPVAFSPSLTPVPTVPLTSGAPVNPSPQGSHPPPPFGMYPGYPPVQRGPGGYAPVPVWPPVNTFAPHPPPGPYPAHLSYPYNPYTHSSQYGSQPYYGPPYVYPPFGHPLATAKEVKKEADGTESDSDSDSSSSGAGQKSEEKGNSSDSKDAQQ